MASRGRIFVVDDDDLIVTMLTRSFKKERYEVQSAVEPEGVIDRIRSWSPDVVFLDISLPGKSGIDILRELKDQEVDAQVIMLTADDSAESAVKAMKLGAVDYLTKPFNIEEVKIVLANVIERNALKQEVRYLRQVSSELIERDIIGSSPAVQELKEKVEKMARAGVSNILITGESGTGKELVARYIHNVMFADPETGYAPFIGVNCTALSETLIESELFGHEKGAFTDAKTDKKGLFEVAKGGTLLLDEIGDMKPDLQSKLLRVLEERTIRKIGGKADIPVDVTVTATTNTVLDEAVLTGDFRKDLFYRLNAFSLHVPPLRERRGDIPELLNHFLAKFSLKYRNKNTKGFSADAERMLTEYDWPGNIRELKNMIERIVVLESAEYILPEHLPAEIREPSLILSAVTAGKFSLPEEGLSLEDLERDLIVQALEKSHHNKSKAAKLLNISYDTLRYQMKKFGLN